MIEAHGISGRPGTRLARLLGDGLRPVSPMRGPRGAPERVVADPAEEARIAAEEGETTWGDPVRVGGLGDLLDRCRERGRASVEIVASRPSLLARMQLGSWFDAPWRTRLIRRLRPLHPLVRFPAAFSPRWLEIAADLAFWDGARQAAERDPWRRWTRTSCAVLVYHRFSGELRPGQERIDIAPARFRRHLRALRLAGFRPVSADSLIDFLEGSGELPRRSVLITVDDAISDCLEPLAREPRWLPQLFAPTAEVGGDAHWLDDRPRVAGWDELRDLEASGTLIGSHAAHHERLTEHSPGDCARELCDSRDELANQLTAPLPLLAYPNGAHDREVRAAAAKAGYAGAFTTEKGRVSAGADPFAIRRVSIHGTDGPLAALWKAITAEDLPGFWPGRA